MIKKGKRNWFHIGNRDFMIKLFEFYSDKDYFIMKNGESQDHIWVSLLEFCTSDNVGRALFSYDNQGYIDLFWCHVKKPKYKGEWL
jgi:hypothetical protein